MNSPNMRLDYIEQTLKHLVESLKQSGYLSPNFQFLTQDEQERAVNKLIEEFIRTEVNGKGKRPLSRIRN